jgi:hypothetical protein
MCDLQGKIDRILSTIPFSFSEEEKSVFRIWDDNGNELSFLIPDPFVMERGHDAYERLEAFKERACSDAYEYVTKVMKGESPPQYREEGLGLADKASKEYRWVLRRQLWRRDCWGWDDILDTSEDRIVKQILLATVKKVI